MTAASGEDDDAPALVLFRSDLRLGDNRALAAAAATGLPVQPVFVLDEESDGVRPIGGARRWWLHRSLEALARDLSALGCRLVLRRGPMGTAVDRLVAETGSRHVFWNRRYDPPAAAADAAMKTSLRSRGVTAESFDGQLLHEPTRLKTKTGGAYKVYTPFFRALFAQDEPRPPVDRPRRLRGFEGAVASDELASWGLLPRTPDWSGGLAEAWTPGETAAQQRLDAFLGDALGDYSVSRDLPGVEGTSRLSPHLAHGEITPFQILAALRDRTSGPGAETFRREIAWREFCYHLLWHNPDIATRNVDRSFDNFSWRRDVKALRAWQRGRTGYPIVDAGMRELWRTGWMHNRVRMIAASFLIKHLLIDWRKGEQWFWDTLVDADPANNPASWQWVAGSGADASPYFRIFNPTLQGEKFDSDGTYVRRYVPEIATISDRKLHRPWDLPKAALDEAGVKLGTTYPVPVVEHDVARSRAMDAYRSTRGTS